MKKGFVAMNKDETWTWFNTRLEGHETRRWTIMWKKIKCLLGYHEHEWSEFYLIKLSKYNWWYNIPQSLGNDCIIRQAVLQVNPENGKMIILTEKDMNIKK